MHLKQSYLKFQASTVKLPIRTIDCKLIVIHTLTIDIYPLETASKADIERRKQ